MEATLLNIDGAILQEKMDTLFNNSGDSGTIFSIYIRNASALNYWFDNNIHGSINSLAHTTSDHRLKENRNRHYRWNNKA